jgi:phosphosulfolactate phosphohydrolase-like enzyme
MSQRKRLSWNETMEGRTLFMPSPCGDDASAGAGRKKIFSGSTVDSAAVQGKNMSLSVNTDKMVP